MTSFVDNLDLSDPERAVKVYITSRSAKDCNATAAELNALGPGKCISVPADLQKIDEVSRLVKEITSQEKVLHVLVNNAGAAWGASVDEYPVRRATIAHCHAPLICMT